MTILLAIDTSTREIGIALYNGIRLLYEASWLSNFHHTIELAPAIERAVAQSGIKTSDVQAIGVALGPGSFTSLRTGLAFAKGFSLHQRIPILGIMSLDVLAASQPVLCPVLAAVIEVGRKRFAVGWYQAQAGQWHFSGKTDLLTAEKISTLIHSPTWICGELSEELRTLLRRKWKNAQLASPAQSRRRPGYLAELAWQRWQSGEKDDPVGLSPIYLMEAG